MAAIQSILAKVLIQVGADEPTEIGTIEIPIDVSVPSKPSGISYPPGVRNGLHVE
ncbi:hypothetical protein [Arthrobacter sp. Soil763]|uniref:hypothetical protein n=1 Tax=Arthrobacter sp. Soil763 TaxID=1736402 RepID=UPI000AAC2281|nr:hypothetical protein [Arthrobacter sp. Soil763]